MRTELPPAVREALKKAASITLDGGNVYQAREMALEALEAVDHETPYDAMPDLTKAGIAIGLAEQMSQPGMHPSYHVERAQAHALMDIALTLRHAHGRPGVQGMRDDAPDPARDYDAEKYSVRVANAKEALHAALNRLSDDAEDMDGHPGGGAYRAAIRDARDLVNGLIP